MLNTNYLFKKLGRGAKFDFERYKDDADQFQVKHGTLLDGFLFITSCTHDNRSSKYCENDQVQRKTTSSKNHLFLVSKRHKCHKYKFLLFLARIRPHRCGPLFYGPESGGLLIFSKSLKRAFLMHYCFTSIITTY